MKRDVEIIYSLLNTISDGTLIKNEFWEVGPDKDWTYNIQLAERSGLIANVSFLTAGEMRLTWEGHELLTVLQLAKRCKIDLNKYPVEMMKLLVFELIKQDRASLPVLP